MATRHHLPVPQPNRGEPEPKQKTAAIGQNAKNRRALGDIGNFLANRAPVAETKPRPVPSFGSQHLSNAQAHAAKNAHIRETKPKVAVNKPRLEVVIDISPDTNEPKLKSSRKKVHTMTSVLTARSKVASGVIDKDPVPDIDASDAGNELAVVDYIEEIYKFYKISENNSRPTNYMGSQVEINSKMRAILADWLIEVHDKFELMPESLYLTFNIIDRYLSVRKVVRRDLQLVGVSAMLIASKYEEIWAPEVNDFICISDRAYTREQVLGMEKEILNVLEWSLTVPTPYVFLVRFIKAAMCDKDMEHMVFFFAELALMQYSVIDFCPSMVAASAVYAAQCTLKKRPLWTDTLKRHTGFCDTQLLDCAQILVKCHDAAPQDRLKFVYTKYSSKQFGAVALHSPATQLLELMG